MGEDRYHRGVPELGKETINMALRFWNGRPAWMLGLFVFVGAAWLCGALYYLASRLLVVLGGE